VPRRLTLRDAARERHGGVDKAAVPAPPHEVRTERGIVYGNPCFAQSHEHSRDRFALAAIERVMCVIDRGSDFVERCDSEGIKLCHTARELGLLLHADLSDAPRAMRGEPSRDGVGPRRDSSDSRWPPSLNLSERVVVRPGDYDYAAYVPAPLACHAPNLSSPASYSCGER
jgi:hypothetical protein